MRSQRFTLVHGRLATILAAAALLGAGPLSAQAGGEFPGSGPRARLLLLGTFHFAYPNRDVHVPGHRVDVLAPDRQREVAEVVERLAAFRPTRVAVEADPAEQGRLDSLYRAWRAGTWSLEANETYQIGFRLAAMLGHARVWAVDAERHDFFVRLAREQLAPREAELLATDTVWRNRIARDRARADSLAARARPTLRETLLAANHPDELARSHMAYHVGFFRFDGEPGGFLGADFVAGWYDRNLRIFRNLQRLTRSPEERILLVIGSGHVPLLRFIAGHSPEFELADPAEYLGATGAGPE